MPVDAAREMGIPVAATPLINYITVAEHVWAYILNWVKRLPSLREHMRSREYPRNLGRFPNRNTSAMSPLGCSAWARSRGRSLASRRRSTCRSSTGISSGSPSSRQNIGMTFVEWDEIVRDIRCALGATRAQRQTEGIIGAREIGLHETERALHQHRARQARRSGRADPRRWRISGSAAVAIDVYAEEPLPIDDPLLRLHEGAGERVTLTPHNAWQSPWTWVRDSQELWFNVRRSLRENRSTIWS